MSLSPSRAQVKNRNTINKIEMAKKAIIILETQTSISATFGSVLSLNPARNLLFFCLFLLLGFSTAAAGDLSTLQRPPLKEPIYQTKPLYCLVVIGLEAETKI